MDSEAYISFVVRLWRDPAGDPARGRWQGEVEHIQSGVRWNFSTLHDLLAFLNQAAAAPRLMPQSDADELFTS